jgi:hypothetical protein
MSDKPKYVIEKNVPLPEPRSTKLYDITIYLLIKWKWATA